MTELHKLLARQVARATDAKGQLDVDRLCALVSASYADEERDRRRIDHANRVMAEEIEAAQQRLQQTAETLRVQNQRFEAALQNMSQGLCLYDAARRLVVCNRRYLDMFRLGAPDALIGQGLVAMMDRWDAAGAAPDGSDPGQTRRRESYLALALRPTRGALQMELADGRSLVINHEPLPEGGFVHTFDDVTAWRQADARMARLASHDSLTDLPNRSLLRERLQALIDGSQHGRAGALLCLDLDRFKAVNDSLGHPSGDLLLVQVTERLQQLVRTTDTVARLGGDEFAILLDHIRAPEHVAELAERLVQAIEQPFDLNGQGANIGVSVGIALVPQDGDTAPDLIKRADLALYEAKAAGRNRYRFFELAMDTQAQSRRELEIDLRRALKDEAFEIHYQPLMDVGAGQVSGFEALLRWRDPHRGSVSPGVFIPMAEELGLIVPLGDWVLRRACREAATWPDPVRLAINVSARQFQLGDSLVRSVSEALAASGLPARRLELEITETVLMADNAATLQTLYRLRDLGVHIVMDDFGIGYSSLAYLRSFPFDKVKIDKSFVQEIGQRQDAVAIIRAVSTLCTSLGITSTAEGVETPEQFSRIAEEACTQAQGFLFSRAVPADDVSRLLQRLNATHA